MTSTGRIGLAEEAEKLRLSGLPGAAEAIEAQLSRVMRADYELWLDKQAERHIAEHHRRRPKLPGER